MLSMRTNMVIPYSCNKYSDYSRSNKPKMRLVMKMSKRKDETSNLFPKQTPTFTPTLYKQLIIFSLYIKWEFSRLN